MKCFYHLSNDAVAQCQKCGRGLCHSCATENNKLICSNCTTEYVEKEKKGSIFALIISVIIFGSIFSSLNSFEKMGELYGVSVGTRISVKLVLSYLYMSGVWGWRRLSRIRFSGIFVLPVIGWLLYFIIKYAVGIAIGIFTAPFDIVIAIKDILFKK